MFVKRALKQIEDLKIEEISIFKNTNKRVKKPWDVELTGDTSEGGVFNAPMGSSTAKTLPEAFEAAVKDLKKEIKEKEAKD